MHRLLREANVRTVPALPETDQAQELLGPLREAKLDHRATQTSQHQSDASHQPNGMAYRIQGDPPTPESQQLVCGVVNSSATSPIQPSVFPPLSTRSSKIPYLPPRCSSFPLPSRQFGSIVMPMHPRMPEDQCPSGSSSGGGASPAAGDVDMSLLGAQWPYPSRSLPTSAPYAMNQGYQTPLTPSSDTLTSPGDHEGIPNWTWMYGSGFGMPGTDCNNGQPGDLNPDWNDVNRVPWGGS